MNQLPTTRRSGSILLLGDVETLLGRTAETLRGYVRTGLLPRPRTCGSAIYWLEQEIQDALAAAPAADKWPGPNEAAPLAQEEDTAAA